MFIVGSTISWFVLNKIEKIYTWGTRISVLTVDGR